MTGHVDAERILDAFLAPEHDQLADRVLEAALADIARTPQRRALRVPWRFPKMSPVLRIALVAVALVALLGAGGAMFLAGSSTPAPSVVVASPTPGATPSATSSAPPTVSPSAAQVAPGITAFTPYTSNIYGLTFGYPDGWTVDAVADRKWPNSDRPGDAYAYSDSFMNPELRDGDQIALGVWQRSAESGADLASREGLAAWFQAHMCDDQIEACETVPDVAVPMCAGKTACAPAILVPLTDSTQAVFADAEGGLITVVSLGRPDGFPAAGRYGGGVQLLKSILATMDVQPFEPGTSQVAPGITGWTTYTSDVYGLTLGYPNDWSLHGAASRKWKDGDENAADDWPYADVFGNPEGKDGESMGLWVWKMKAGSGADITSREGLAAWAESNLCKRHAQGCETASDVAAPMCSGGAACHPAILVPLPDGTSAFIADSKTGTVTMVELGRPDGFSAAARYGGGVQLLKSILATMDVYTPLPGQIPPSS
jgi:hypothetical protein